MQTDMASNFCLPKPALNIFIESRPFRYYYKALFLYAAKLLVPLRMFNITIFEAGNKLNQFLKIPDHVQCVSA